MPPSIPQALKAEARWVCWRYTTRNGKPTKVPIDPKNGQLASCTDSATWSGFSQAISAAKQLKANGVGFVLGDGFSGVDLDKCRDPNTGQIKPWAKKIMDRVPTYWETSPSGTGLHAFILGTLPTGRRRKGRIEMYDDGRYFTVTGDSLNGSTVTNCEDQLRELHSEIFPTEKPTPIRDQLVPNSLLDQEILDKALSARNGGKFERLWNGDSSGYDSHSEADLALCSILAFWTGPDAGRIDQLFRQSGLMRPKWDRDNYRNKTINEVLTRQTETWTQGEVVRGQIKKEEIVTPFRKVTGPGTQVEIDATEGDLTIVSEAALDALVASNVPERIFRHGGLPSRIESDDDNIPMIQPLNEHRMRYEMARSAHWYKPGKIGTKPSKPPLDVVRDVLATPDLPFPILKQFVECPVIGPDGEIQQKPGYDLTSRTYYREDPSLEMPPIPKVISKEHLATAEDSIMEMIGDFPFTDDTELANCIGLYLSFFVRGLYSGPSPLHLIEKPSPGTGATLLSEAISYPALGRFPSAMVEGRDEDEWRKRLTARLRNGPAVIIVDNLKNRLQSASLSSCLTSDTWEDRILGVSLNIRIPVACVWIATGNNPTLSDEIMRRTVRIRIDAKQDRAWMRPNNSFTHPNLREWVAENRGNLIWAALILGKYWIQENRPQYTGSVLGMFENWTKTIGGILQAAGIKGFLSNLTDFYDQADTDGVVWRSFISAWWEKHSNKEVGVSDLWQLNNELDHALDVGDKSERSQRTKLGLLLRQMKDRQFTFEVDDIGPDGGTAMENYRILAGDKTHRAQQWRLENE